MSWYFLFIFMWR